MAVKVYKYGAQAPDNLDLVREQMRLGHSYYNALVEAERERRMRYHNQAAVDEKLEGKALYKRRAELARADKENRLADTRRIRGQFSSEGLYWGTYLLIERAFDLACKKSLHPQRPHFRRWSEASKQIGVQIQKGKKAERFYQLRPALPRRGHQSDRYQILSLRVGSENRKPRYVDIPIKMHRPIEGTVTWVSLNLRRVADKEVWTVCFTVNTDEEVWMEGRGVCAIDIGWRIKDDDTIRMAYLRDDRGRERELLSPPFMRSRHRLAEEIASRRKLALNRLWEERRGDLSVLGINRQPESVGHMLKQITEDIERPEWLEEWLHRDRRQWRREANLRRRAVASRRDVVRNFAAEMRRQYETLIVEDCNWKDLKEETDSLPQGARRNEHAAAPGELSAALKALPGAVEVEAAYTTLTCCVCGFENEKSAALVVTCESCGDVRDQDERACRNLLKAFEAGEGKPAKKKTSRKRRGRFLKTEEKTVEP